MAVAVIVQPEKRIVATSPWLRSTKRSLLKRVVLVQVDGFAYAVHLQVRLATGESDFRDTYSIQFNHDDSVSKNNALKLAFVVFNASANHHVLHSKWVEHVAI